MTLNQIARAYYVSALLCCVLGMVAVGSIPLTQSPGVHMGEPPAGVARIGAPSTLVVSPQFQASANLSCSERKIRVLWRYSTANNFNSPEASLLEEFPLTFWPTACETTATNHLVIAGKRRNGSTHIERWTLKKPLLLSGSAGGGVSLSAQGLAETSEVYDAAQTGKDMVRGMVRKRGALDRVLLQFHDSRDLYELDFSQDPAVLAVALLHSAEPALTGDFDNYQGGNHSQLGFVYAFANVGDPDRVPALLLKDSNRDGVIDWHGIITGAEWEQQGLGNKSNYIEFGGR